MGVTADPTTAAKPGPFDRLLGVFTEVHPGEGARAVTMLVNIFLILVSYYIIKTVREPLILTTDVPGWLQALGIAGPAEVKTYAAAGQALVLEARGRHVVEAFVGPAQRMRRDDDVVHREQRIGRVDRLLLEHVERRARDAAGLAARRSAPARRRPARATR